MSIDIQKARIGPPACKGRLSPYRVQIIQTPSGPFSEVDCTLICTHPLCRRSGQQITVPVQAVPRNPQEARIIAHNAVANYQPPDCPWTSDVTKTNHFSPCITSLFSAILCVSKDSEHSSIERRA